MKKRFFTGFLCLVMLTSILAAITVAADFTAIDLSQTTVTAIKVGDTTQLVVNGETGVSDVTYTSSNPEFATVSETGLVEGKKAGLASITVTAGEVSDSVMITVSDSAPKAANPTPTAAGSAKIYYSQDTEIKRAGNTSSIKAETSANFAWFKNTSYNTLSYWIYDDGTNQSSLLFKAKKNNTDASFDGIAPADAGGNNFSIWTGYNGTTTQTYYPNPTDKGFVSVSEKSYVREKGWHQVVIRLTDETLKVYYDGKQLFYGFGRQHVNYSIVETFITATSPAFNISDVQQLYTGETEIDIEKGTSAAKREISFDIDENGTLAYWKSSLSDGETLSVSDGFDLQLKATPAEGYMIDSFTVNGEDLDYDAQGYATITVSEDAEVKVTYKQSLPSNVTVTYDSSKGTVTKADGSTITSGESFVAYEISGLILSATANDGFKVSSIKINGKDYDGSLSEIKVTEFTENITVEILFAETLSSSFTELYVSNSGSDIRGDGTKAAPFGSIQMARDTIRKLGGNLPEGGITVYVEGGEYPLTDSIEFTEADSGTETSPITYKAYNGKVSFIGGKKLATDSFKKVTDKNLLNRIIDENARDYIMQIDVAAQGVEVLPLASTGYTNTYMDSLNTAFYMNGTLLEGARWPNNDESQLLLKCEPYLVGDEDCKTYNGLAMPYRFKYPDPDNRTSKWTVKENDMFVGGALVYFWAEYNLVMKTVDTENKVFTTRDIGYASAKPGDGWAQQYKIYFSHVFEELDRPGEYYYDRDTGILYLYPVGDTENAEIYVSEMKTPMLKLNNLSYVNFDGIGFKNSTEKHIEADNCDHIKVKNGEFSGTSSPKGIFLKKSNNITFEGNYFYNFAGSALEIEGSGNRDTLESGEILIKNNMFSNCTVKPTGGAGAAGKAAIGLNKSCGITISHNEFTDMPKDVLLSYESSDVLIEYNKFRNLSYFASDAGALYWGRDITTLGFTICYNYFEDIGSQFLSRVMEAGDTSSIFTDDGSIGPEVYGNVFYNAGTKGGPFRSNTGEYWDVYNNVFVSDQGKYDYWVGLTTWHSAAEFQYGPDNKTIPQMWRSIDPFTKHLSIKDEATGNPSASGYYNETRINRLLSDTWKNKYAGTNWERLFDLYSEENITKALALAKEVNEGTKTRDDLMTFLDTELPDEYKNAIHGNISVGDVTRAYIPDRYQMWDNNVVDTNVGKSWFKEYGKDWTLTDAGLAEVRKLSPDFENIPFNEIGLLTNVGSKAPAVSINDAVISGIPAVGNVIAPSYTFTDPDGHKEGNSKIYWYVSGKANGTYEVVEGKAGRYFEIPEGYEGMYLKYAVIPYDTYSVSGKKIESEPIQVIATTAADITELTNVIKTATDLVNGAVVGTTTGTYSQDSIDTLKKAIEDATAVVRNSKVSQYEVNNAVKALETAITKFKISENLDLEFMNINKILADEDGWVNQTGGALDGQLKNGTLTLDKGSAIRYTAEKYGNTIFTFKMRFETEGDDLPAINSAETEKTYKVGGAAVKVRGQNTKGVIYDATTDFGLLAWFKNTTYELQEYCPAGLVTSFDNDVFTEFNKDYTISYGAYDTEDGTRVVLYVDGKLIADLTCSNTANEGLEGYLAFRGSDAANIKTIISAADTDLTELNKAIAEAEDFVKNAEIGTGYNQYSKESVDALSAVIAEAKELAAEETVAQIPVDRKALELTQAILDVKATSGDKIEVSGKTEIEINYDVPEAEINATKNVPVSIVLQKDELTPEITLTTATDNGKASLQIPAGSELSGKNWDGKITNPVYSGTPSANVTGNLSVDAVYTTGGSVVESDGLVRFVFPNAKNKRVYYLNESGKYVEVTKRLTEDSFKAAETAIGLSGAAKLNVGNDIVVYSSYITEYIICTNAAADEDYQGGGSQGGTAVSPNPGGSSSSGGFHSSYTGTPGMSSANTFVFSDMTNHWAKNDVMSMYNAGIVSGVTANTFEPDRPITRAEFATLITKGLKLTAETTDDFSDVKADDWFAPFVGAAAKAGIIVGADGKFRPNDTITREEMAVIIVKAYNLLGGEGANGAIDNFSDKAEISSWAKAYVDSAASAGLISGMGDGTFGPKANATRAQAASLVYRVIK